MSLRGDAERVLKEWTAPDAAQEQLRLAYLDHLATYPDGMYKPCAAGHLTASALVVDPAGGRVLLTLHRKIRAWLQLGGHCEPEDATLAAAALREATEESGIEGLTLLSGAGADPDPAPSPVPVPVPVRLDRHLTPCAWHLDVEYAALAPPGAVESISDESLDLRWYGYEEVAAAADSTVVRLLEATRALL